MYPTLDEIHEPEEAAITGCLPSWVHGTLVRTGPGKFDFDDNFSVNHFLDGKYCGQTSQYRIGCRSSM